MWRVVLTLVVLSSTAHAQPAEEQRTPFDRGRFGVSLRAGSQSAFGTRYIFVGAGIGYYVLDGVELGAFAAHFFGDGPSIDLVSPSVRYVAQPLANKWPIIPYIGVFFTHAFVGGSDSDVDNVGARAGGLVVSGPYVFGGGIAIARAVSDCTRDCTVFYPDVSMSFSF